MSRSGQAPQRTGYRTEISSTRVLFDGIPAPLLYSSANELGLIVPYGVSSGTAILEVEYGGQRSGPVPVSVAPTAPAGWRRRR